MKNRTDLFLLVVLFFSCYAVSEASNGVIKTKTPKREKGQADALLLRCDPIPAVRVACIGLGMRGPGAVSRMTNIPGAEIVALCDVEKDRVEKTNAMLEKNGFPKDGTNLDCLSIFSYI